MLPPLRFRLNKNLYLRDPEETELGRRIFHQSIRLIDDLGFEDFTFKKLAAEIDSTEASVYRYFENKNKLLLYLSSWYWVWLEYRITFRTANIRDAKERLKIIVKVLSETSIEDTTADVDLNALIRIVVSESPKAYLNKAVDEANKAGLYRDYKSVCQLISSTILEVDPDYSFPHSLASTLLEASHYHPYVAGHLPSLTDVKVSGNEFRNLHEYLEHLLFTVIQIK